MRIYFLILLISSAIYTSCKDSEPEVVSVDQQGLDPNAVKFPVNGSGEVDTMNLPRISFENTSYNFDTVQHKDIVTHRFAFKNTGKSDLIISKAKSTCGCTVPDYPKTPIAPGDTSSIKVVFDTENKVGVQKKPVILSLNTYPNQVTLDLEGFVQKTD